MGFFRKKKEEHTQESDKAVLEPVQIKSPEEIQKDRIVNELEILNDELKSKTEHLNSISEKLAKTKSEYDEIIGIFMTAKKDASERKKETDGQKLEHQQLLRQIEAAKLDLASTKREAEEKKLMLDEIKKNLQAVQKSYDESRKAQEVTIKSLSDAKSELDKVTTEIQEIRKERELKKKEIELAEKGLKFIEKHADNTADRTSQKNVVAAASSVVSSLNAKIIAMQKEIDVLKTTLQKERVEHQESKEEIDES